MVLEREAARHRRMLARTFLSSRVEISRPEADGTLTLLGEFAANIQSTNSVSGTTDIDVTDTTLGRDALWCYLLPDVEIDNGYRVDWGGVRWVVASVDGPLTANVYVKVMIARETAGADPEMLTFYRRKDGVTTEVGVFAVRRQEDEPAEASTGTAAGSTVRGTMVGADELLAVRVGDWFAIDGFPGRVLAVDQTGGRVELNYERQVVTP